MAACATPVRHAAPALSLLFARYVAGKIAQAHWDAFSAALDEADASGDERAALAAFFLDAAGSGQEVKLPQPGELEEVLALTR
ncbi:MAG: hypothetical protein R3362_01155 [Rhodothermales bacterium]|nr:hypothetical protein [Rhodothermales bacterium]